MAATSPIVTRVVMRNVFDRRPSRISQGDQTQVSHLTASRNRSDSDGAV